MMTVTLKLDTHYAACSPELGVLSYGGCQGEALNNLAEEIRQHKSGGESSRRRKKIVYAFI